MGRARTVVTPNIRTRCRWPVFAALLIFLAAALPSESLEITVEARSGGCTSATVLAVGSSGEEASMGESAKRLEWNVEVPGSQSVQLDPAQEWDLSLHCPEMWAQGVHLGPHAGDEPIHFTLVPSAQLTGRIEVDEGLNFGGSLQVRLQPAHPGSDVGWRSAEEECAVEGASFECVVPAGRVDVRLASAGFAPHYAWEVNVAAGKAFDLGLLKLVEGASVAGTVVTSGSRRATSGPTDEVLIVIEPETHLQLDDSGHERLALRTERATADGQGRFQVTGLGPGTYQLTASASRFSTTGLTPIVLERGEELFLERPIELAPLVTLEAYVDPPQDVEGRPWRIRLLGELHAAAGATLRNEVTVGAVSSAGYWSHEGLDAGQYLLRVEDAEGSIWTQSEVEVTPTLAPLILQLPAVAVEGEVLLGGEPVLAEVIFGTTTGSPSVRLESNDEGRFEGVLPHGGEWALEIAIDGRPPQAVDSVEVERGPSGVAEVTLRLPDTRLAGLVVDANGKPVAGANVLVIREQAKAPAPQREMGVKHRRRREASVTTDAEGHFSIDGLLPAELALVAHDHTRSSEWVQVELMESTPRSPIRLVVRERAEVTGRVTAANGPVAGAIVVGFSRDGFAPLDLFAQSVTGPDGRFAFEMTAGTRLLDLIVAAPGHDVFVRRTSWTSEPIEVGLGNDGGRLFLEGLRPGTTMVHAGAELAIEKLASILLPLGLLEFDEGGLRIANLEAGGYALCSPGRSKACVEGSLSAGTELTLSVPGSAEQGTP